jgi:hypothetical protein
MTPELPSLDRRAALTLGALSASTLLVNAQVPANPRPPEGYADQVSYRPGDTLKLHISSRGKFSLEIARFGVKREIVFKKEGLAGQERVVPASASSHGCQWPSSFEHKIPDDWTTGYYSARLTSQEKSAKPLSSEAYFIVRPSRPGNRSKILLQFSTNTYNAYTNWGGYSLYSYNGKHKVQGRRVSFNRPQTSQFPNWEAAFVAWAESNGYALDYAANSDLEFHPELLKDYKLVLSVGHDEYWSAPMRDNLEAFIGTGGNVAFFSGNTCCWQVRSEEQGRALACFKQSFGDDPIYKTGDFKLLSTLWSHYLVNRPENQLTGVGFLWGGYHRSHGQFMDGPGTFTVHRPKHWLYEGTNLALGSTFGAKLPQYKVVGYECDGCELTWKDGLPYPTHSDGTPKTFEVLATAPAKWHPDDCEWYEKWQKGRVGQATLGCYTRGGTVVTVGTTDWSNGLRGNDPHVVQITKNVLNKLGT